MPSLLSAAIFRRTVPLIVNPIELVCNIMYQDREMPTARHAPEMQGAQVRSRVISAVEEVADRWVLQVQQSCQPERRVRRLSRDVIRFLACQVGRESGFPGRAAVSDLPSVSMLAFSELTNDSLDLSSTACAPQLQDVAAG
jgi:hypothetical protein